MRKSFKKVTGLVLVALLIFSLFTGCAGRAEEVPPAEEPATTEAAVTPADGEKVRAAFVYAKSADDGGWFSAQERGRQYLIEQLPYVETTMLENVPAGTDARNAFKKLAREGYQAIFAAEFSYMDDVVAVAKEFPETKFFHAAGFQRADNLSTYFWRGYEGRYLTGLLAGQLTESNIIGYSAAFPIPSVIQGINAFTLGLHETNPEAKVKVVWCNTWFDPGIEMDAANSLLDVGADVLCYHVSAPSTVQAADERGAYSIGYDSDRREFGENSLITSIVCDWGPYFVQEIEKIKNGNWESSDYWGGLSDGSVELIDYGPMVTDEMKAMVEERRQEIVNGEFDIFKGQIIAQDGSEKVAAGSVMNDGEIALMNWLIKGIDGTIK